MAGNEELGAGRVNSQMQVYESLTVEEKVELDRRRRASELEGGMMTAEMDGGERVELEARRRMARDLYEIG
ncbi:hypothetical protein IFR05_001097 [Cadophora sp. M221]|nr:hypothetical protein IFR05_001097 [Cadophora sp. M221]